MKSDTFVIVNPSSGGGRALRAEPEVRSLLASRGYCAEFVHSKSSQDIRQLAAGASSDGFRYVVALGGDGAFHHLIEGVRGSEAVAGFFPAGNGNDIARALGIPTDPIIAADVFSRARPRSVDLIQVSFNDGGLAHYLGAGGMGMDAEAAYLANTRFKGWPGVTRYLAGALSVFHQPLLQLTAQTDGVQWVGRALFVAVANAPSYGSGVRIAPDAKVDDGWLNVVIVGEVSLARLLEALPIVLTSGDLRGFPEVMRYRARQVALCADRLARVHGDGEELGQSPAHFKILPHAIRVMTPQSFRGPGRDDPMR
ncbi:MAG: diacylglycerol kinase family protein [Candidatus Acidiferrales bacterium]